MSSLLVFVRSRLDLSGLASSGVTILTEFPDSPLSVLGVTKTHAQRAIRWLRVHRGLLAFYRAEDGSLNSWELKEGRDKTYEVLNKALEVTRK